MRVLVTGRNGQLARCLADARPQGVNLSFAARPLHDLERPESLVALIRKERPDVIINAAGYTLVDAAEDETGLAQTLNADAPSAIGRAAAQAGSIVIQVSTDYVFDGTSSRPYRENDPTNPVSVYGQTKLAGEQAIAASGCDFVIARVSWLFSTYGSNFVRTMLTLAETRDVVRVVADQRGTPTFAGDVANALYRIAEASLVNPARSHDIVNVANSDVCSWADFAEAIFASSDALGGPAARVERIASDAFPTRAKRPANSVLDVRKLEADYGIRLPSWRESIDPVVEALLAERTQDQRRGVA